MTSYRYGITYTHPTTEAWPGLTSGPQWFHTEADRDRVAELHRQIGNTVTLVSR